MSTEDYEHIVLANYLPLSVLVKNTLNLIKNKQKKIKLARIHSFKQYTCNSGKMVYDVVIKAKCA